MKKAVHWSKYYGHTKVSFDRQGWGWEFGFKVSRKHKMLCFYFAPYILTIWRRK